MYFPPLEAHFLAWNRKFRPLVPLGMVSYGCFPFTSSSAADFGNYSRELTRISPGAKKLTRISPGGSGQRGDCTTSEEALQELIEVDTQKQILEM